MASEQLSRADPPPPSVVKDTNKSQGIVDTSTEDHLKDSIAFWIERVAVVDTSTDDFKALFDSIAFWIERFAVFLVFFCWLPPKVWDFLHTAIGLLIFSNYIYLISFFSSLPQESGKDKSGMDEQKTEQEEAKLDFSLKEAKEEVKSKDKMNKIIDEENQQKAKLDDSPEESKEEGKAKDERINKIHEENAGQQKAKVDTRVRESKEEEKAKDERINKIDEENTEQEKAKLDYSLKESKEEEAAKNQSNNTDEDTTGVEQKGKLEGSSKELEVSLKELKEEVRRNSSAGEGFQSLEAKYLAKYENLLQKYLDNCHGNWEEERSHLIYELGAARASLEIYRALLHDLHYDHQP